MKKKLAFFSLLIGIPFLAASWGMWGHQHINRAAIFALPEPLRIFYYNHADFITEEAVVPDVRKYSMNDKAEFPRHYIDLEDYNYPADTLPREPSKAYALYDEKTRNERGIVPWYIIEITKKLTDAFKNHEKAAILLLSADLGHYIGDANMPLHTSSNHNGQKSGQEGIHSFWESQLPETYGNKYNLNTGPAVYINDISKETWDMIGKSHALVDSVLSIDKTLKIGFEKEKIYKLDANQKIVKNLYGSPIHSEAYAKAYHEACHNMIERQMRKSIQSLSSYWYTAWVNAGKPDLSGLDNESYTQSHSENYKRELSLWETGKTIEIGNRREF
jgi:hypothetical protein